MDFTFKVISRRSIILYFKKADGRNEIGKVNRCKKKNGRGDEARGRNQVIGLKQIRKTKLCRVKPIRKRKKLWKINKEQINQVENYKMRTFVAN